MHTDADALLLRSLSAEVQLNACAAEGQFAELTHAVLLARGDDKVFGLRLLQDEPHAFDVVASVAPIAQAGEVAQVEFLLRSLCNARCSEGDLAGDEGLASALALVVEEDAGAAVHIVGLAVFLDNPEAIELGYGIGRIGMEGCLLVLRHLFHFAVEFGSGRLIDATRLREAAEAHGFQHT